MAASPMPDMPDILTEALTYRARGFSVFPICTPTSERTCVQHGECDKDKAGKKPLIKWEPYQERLPTEQEIAQWWRRWPSANIGIVTGKVSGFVALDADSLLARSEAMKRGMPPGPTVFTGVPDGVHYWLEYPGVEVRNFIKKIGGLDFRGDGGYVLAPPSLHRSGVRYRWANDSALQALHPVPPWLLEHLTNTSPNGTSSSEPHASLDLSTFLHGIPEGQRDDQLFKLACKLRSDNVPQSYADWIIQQAARNCQPAFDTQLAREKVTRAYVQYAPTPHIDLRAGLLEAVTDAPPEQWLEPISTILGEPEEAVDWLIDGLFSVGASGWIGAEPKLGKSWLVLELIYCLATATPLLGKFPISQKRRVVYIQEEDPRARVRRRLKQLIRGTEGRMAPADHLVRLAIRTGFKLDSPAWAARLRAVLTAEPADVVFLDVFQRLHLKDENSQQQMAEVMEVLNALSREFVVAFIIVHHNRKPQAGNEARANQMLRGSGVLAGWGECSLFLRKSKTGNNRFAVQPESKDAPELDEFVVALEDTPNGGVRLVCSDTVADEHLAGNLPQFLDATLTIIDAGMDCAINDVAERVGVNRSTAQRALDMLVESGHLEVTQSIFGKFRSRKNYYRRPSRRDGDE